MVNAEDPTIGTPATPEQAGGHVDKEGKFADATANKESKGDSNKKKNRVPKGTTVPTMSMQEIGAAARGFKARDSRSGDRELLGQILANKTKSSTFEAKVSTLRSFGFLTMENNQWSLTELGEQLAFPGSAHEEQLALCKLFVAHPIVNKIYGHMRGKDLQPDYLPDAIEKHCQVPTALKNDWSKYFTEGARFVHLTIRNGTEEMVVSNLENVTDSPAPKEISPIADPHPLDTHPHHGKPTPKHTPSIDDYFAHQRGNLTRRTISNDREVIIFIPENITRRDQKKIEAILDSVRAGLEGYIADEEFEKS